jgi:hypothetical protein
MSREEKADRGVAASVVRNTFRVAAPTVATAATAVVSLWRQWLGQTTWLTSLIASTGGPKKGVVVEETIVTAGMARISSSTFRQVHLFGTAIEAIFCATCPALESE